MHKMTIKGALLAILTCFIWACAFPILKTIYPLMGITHDAGAKLTLAGMRFFVSGILILGFFMVYKKQSPKVNGPKSLGLLLILGIFQTTCQYALFFVGLANTTAIKSSVLTQSSIFFVVILAHFVFHDDKISRGKVMGLMLGLVGIVVVNVSGLQTSESLFSFAFTGEGFMILSGLCSAISTLMVKKIGHLNHPLLTNGWQMTLGGLILLMMGYSMYGGLIAFQSFLEIALFLGLVMISSVGFTLWYILLQHFRAGDLSVFTFMVPILGTGLSIAFIPEEHLSFFVFIGLLLVSLGIYLSNQSKNKLQEANQ